MNWKVFLSFLILSISECWCSTNSRQSSPNGTKRETQKPSFSFRSLFSKKPGPDSSSSSASTNIEPRHTSTEVRKPHGRPSSSSHSSTNKEPHSSSVVGKPHERQSSTSHSSTNVGPRSSSVVEKPHLKSNHEDSKTPVKKINYNYRVIGLEYEKTESTSEDGIIKLRREIIKSYTPDGMSREYFIEFVLNKRARRTSRDLEYPSFSKELVYEILNDPHYVVATGEVNGVVLSMIAGKVGIENTSTSAGRKFFIDIRYYYAHKDFFRTPVPEETLDTLKQAASDAEIDYFTFKIVNENSGPDKIDILLSLGFKRGVGSRELTVLEMNLGLSESERIILENVHGAGLLEKIK